MAFTPCLGKIAANIDQDCDNPRVSGYESIALIINRDDIDWSSLTVAHSKRTENRIKGQLRLFAKNTR